MSVRSVFPVAVFTVLIGLLTGCATQVTEVPSQPVRASVPLGEFKKIIVVEAELAPEYAGQGANEKAARKINEGLLRHVSNYLSGARSVTLSEFKAISFAEDLAQKDTLIIKPYIKQIKFIGGAARFWAGAMAGSSVVIMDTAFIDAASGEQIGLFGSYRKAGSYSDAFGVQSNVMLDQVAEDVGVYISANR